MIPPPPPRHIVFILQRNSDITHFLMYKVVTWKMLLFKEVNVALVSRTLPYYLKRSRVILYFPVIL
jgi:hypothetical protein